MKKSTRPGWIILRVLAAALVVINVFGQVSPLRTVNAAAALTVTPITWNIIGLDSNNVMVGPNDFPIGARVCNTGSTTANNVKSTFHWETASDPYINFRAGTLTQYTADGINLSPAQCTDFYYEVEVARNAGAYNPVSHARGYYIEATATEAGTNLALLGRTPRPRELYVEHLISQSRNSVNNVRLNGVSVANGGTMTLMVGGTYTIELDGATATNGYNQLESFINFNNTIFQILSVNTTYSVGGANDRLYADACGWDNVPSSPTYRSCIGGDNKAGGMVTTVYKIHILGGGGTTQTLNTLLYDFSGSSFHYNADFSVSARFAAIIDPASIKISKGFSPNPTTAGGSSTLTFNITNPTTATISGVSFSDTLPSTPGAMVIANPPGAATTNCGTPTLTAAAGSSAITFANGTLAPNATCTIKVNVTVPVVGTYNNTTGVLQFSDGTNPVSSGNTASASLEANNTPPPPAPICGQTLAKWTFSGVTTTLPTPNPINANTYAGNVSVHQASFFPAANQSIATPGYTAGSGDPAWLGYGWGKSSVTTGVYYRFDVDTRNYTDIQMQFAAYAKNSGPNMVYVDYNTTGTGPSIAAPFASSALVSPTTWYAIGVPASAGTYFPAPSTTGTTYFYVFAGGAQNPNSGSDLHLDDVTFTGCSTPLPVTISKTFTPAAVAVGSTTNLNFTLTNPNGTAINGVQFNDTLPAGLTVANGSSAQCGGTLTTTAPDSISFTGGTLAANGNCTIPVTVTVTTAGPHQNVSGFVSSTQTGTNSGSNGFGTAPVTGILPPSIAKSFGTNPILANGRSRLSFTITNPNQDEALNGVAFTDPLPANMLVSSPPNAAAAGCGTPSFAPLAGATSLAFSNGTIAGGGTCTVAVDVTAPAGTYNNTTQAVTSSNGGTGNTAAASLTVNAPNPGLVFVKQISTSADGPWTRFVGVAPGSSIYYRFILENIGDVPLTLTAPVINDPLVSTAACAWPASIPVGTPTVDPTATCVVGPITALAGDHPNTATANWQYGGISHTSQPSSADYLGAQPALTLLKEVGRSAAGPWSSAIVNVAPGAADIYYRLTVQNTGNAALSPVSVSDPQVDASGCTFTDPLLPGESSSCVVGPVTAASVIGEYTNTATASGAYAYNPAITVSSPPSTASYTITSPNLVVEKTNDAVGGATAGKPFNWLLTVRNTGTDAAVFDSGQVILTDTLPGGTTYGTPSAGSFTGVTNAAKINCAVNSGVMNCAASGGSVTIDAGGSFTVTLSATVQAPGPLTNSAEVDPDNNVAESDEGNNTGQSSVTVGQSADLGINKSSSDSLVIQNGSITYTLVVTNAGPSAADNAILTDPVVPGIVLTEVTCGSASGGAVCSDAANTTIALLQGTGIIIPTLPAGGSVTFTVNATITAGSGAAVNSATITAPDGVTEPTGPNTLPNTDGATTEIIPLVDLGLTKTGDPASVNPNGTVTYTIAVTNAGPSAADNAVLVDTPDAGITIENVTCGTVTNGAVCPAPADMTADLLQGAGISIPTFPASSSLTFTVTATITAAAGTVTNTAEILPPPGTEEPTGAEALPNTGSATTDVIEAAPEADLGLTKTGDPASVSPNGMVTYTIVVSNAGPNVADGATLTDPPVPGITITGITCGAATNGAVCPLPDGATVALLQSTGIIIPTLPASSSVTFTLTAQISAVSGQVTNAAAVTVPAGVTERTGPDTLPNTGSAVITVSPTVDLGITKDDSQTAVVPNTTVHYTVMITNAGPSAADGAVFTDAPVAGITVNNVSCGATTNGAVCPTAPTVAQMQGSGIVIPTLPATGSLTFTVDAVIMATSGTVTNTAVVQAPGGTIELTGANTLPNMASDSDTAAGLPVLSITKDDGHTIVSPGASLTYAITASNSGNAAAKGVKVVDNLPVEVTFVSADQNGAYDSSKRTVSWPAFSLEPGAVNAQTFHVTVTVNPAPAEPVFTNVATIQDDGSSTGGTPLTGSAEDTDQVAQARAKALIGSSDSGSTSPQVLVGEILTYQISLDVPPGTMHNLTAQDVMSQGLAFVRCVSVTPGQLTTSLPGGFAAACAAPTNPTVSAEPQGSQAKEDQGRRINFRFGDITNAGEAVETLQVQYQVVVLDSAKNVNGASGLKNSLVWAWDAGTLTGAAQPVNIIEANLSINKTADRTSVTPNGKITFTLAVKHTAKSAAPAYHVLVKDVLPKGLTYVPGSLRIASGPAGGVADASAAPTLTARWPVFGQGETATITFEAVYTGSGKTVNTASVVWESLMASPVGAQSPYNPLSTERYFDPSNSAINNYSASSSLTIQGPSDLPVTGFAPGMVTSLPAQPQDKRYAETGMWLEIPRLGASLPILGVPLADGSWDLTWLSNQAGYLQGTAFPGQAGTTGITAHVTLADGTPGPFQNLAQLRWGDQVILHAYGYRYIYEVRINSVVQPEDLSIFKNDGYTWLTLITCKNYNETKNAYENRVAVRAVLTQVQPDATGAKP